MTDYEKLMLRSQLLNIKLGYMKLAQEEVSQTISTVTLGVLTDFMKQIDPSYQLQEKDKDKLLDAAKQAEDIREKIKEAEKDADLINNLIEKVTQQDLGFDTIKIKFNLN